MKLDQRHFGTLPSLVLHISWTGGMGIAWLVVKFRHTDGEIYKFDEAYLQVSSTSVISAAFTTLLVYCTMSPSHQPNELASEYRARTSRRAMVVLFLFVYMTVGFFWYESASSYTL
jgi:hypothetical protein